MNQLDPQKRPRVLPKLLYYSPWIVAVTGGVLIFLLLIAQSSISTLLAEKYIWLLIGLGIAFAGIFYYLTKVFLRLVDDRRQLIKESSDAERKASDATRHLYLLTQLNDKFSKAREEKEIIDALVHCSVDVSGAIGGSYVPLDDRGLPMAAASYGDYPASVISSWTDYLASPAVRHRCYNCKKAGYQTESCPLFTSPFSETISMYCLPLKRFGREYGVLNLYLGKCDQISENTQKILNIILDESALALEGTRFREEKSDAICQMKELRNKIDLHSQLLSVIEKSLVLSESEFGLLLIDNRVSGESELFLSVGDYKKPTNLSVDQIWQKSFDSGEGIIISETSGYLNSTLGISSAVISPLLIEDSPLYGVIIVGNNRHHLYEQYQLEALQTMAFLVAMFIRTIDIQADLEFQTMMAERTRLAREIHDGLAQTLGFLKMQTTQMQNYLVRDEIFSLQQSLEKHQRILTEVYRETRQTIDGLRLTPSELGFSSWLHQTVEDFSDNFGLSVELIDIDCIQGLAHEVQAQLFRIFQEALSNVRKHAKANHVWISCAKNGEDLIIEVRDNGIGFTPDELPAPSRYGLQIMQERSDLINAEFQVISKPMNGTIVRLRLPLGVEIKTT